MHLNGFFINLGTSTRPFLRLYLESFYFFEQQDILILTLLLSIDSFHINNNNFLLSVKIVPCLI